MSLRLEVAAVRAYDQLKIRTGRARRGLGARDSAVIATVGKRLEELIADYRLGSQEEHGITYVFWTEVSALVDQGALDDLAGGM